MMKKSETRLKPETKPGFTLMNIKAANFTSFQSQTRLILTMKFEAILATALLFPVSKASPGVKGMSRALNG
jgi:hypothetical protein